MIKSGQKRFLFSVPVEQEIIGGTVYEVSLSDTTTITDVFNGYLPTLTMTKFMFRNDDGSEITATPLANENTVINLLQNNTIRLRIQIDSVGSNTGKQFQLEFRRVGDTAWNKVV